ncbi:MAG: hydroxymethylbilane synthase, partial [Fimbriimonadaceae bacterium]|nr:hydroxymethylbilane synthase [Alphaproteobacteria bacterium]
VQTRLRKLQEGVADATFLAYAGLRRLGITDHIAALIEPEDMLPAVGQGAICVEVRKDDPATGPMVATIHDTNTGDCVIAERAFLKVLDGSCRTPIAGLAQLDGASLHFRGQVLSPDGAISHKIEKSGPQNDAANIGAKAGAEIKALLPADFFEEH